MLLPTSTLLTPSTSQLTALRRAPLIERLTVLASPVPTSSVRSLETPGASVASWTKLRLLMGSSCTRSDPTSDCNAAVGCTDCVPVTSTTSLTPPTDIVASTTMRSFTERATPRTTRGSKPESVNVTSYCPMGSSGAVYCPCSLVTRSIVWLVPTCLSVTVTPGSTPPLPSVTVPMMVPVVSWARARVASVAAPRVTMRQKTRGHLRMAVSPGEPAYQK